MTREVIRPSIGSAGRAIIALLAGGLVVAGLALAVAIGARAEPPRTPREPSSLPTHGVAMHGAPLLPPNFDHFPYANPAAKKGGRLRVGLSGTFDSLNPFNIKAGSTAQGLVGNVFQTLMARSQDEPFTFYGQIARSIDLDADREHVTFHLDPRAHFSDSTPLTSADVLFSFDLLKTKGRPQQRVAFSLVKSIDAPDALTVRYDLTGAADRELPLILALMPVLPKHATDVEHFQDATLAPPVGSGAYVIADVQPGARLLLRRDPNYWGKDVRAGAASITSTRST